MVAGKERLKEDALREGWRLSHEIEQDSMDPRFTNCENCTLKLHMCSL